MRLNAFLIGPRAGGRAYGLRARSTGAWLAAEDERFIGGEVALMLSTWAARPEAPACGTFFIAAPTPTGRVLVMRGDYIDRLALGTVAGGLGVVLDGPGDGSVHRLVRHLPRAELRPDLVDQIETPDATFDVPLSDSACSGMDDELAALLAGERLCVRVLGPETTAEALMAILEAPEAGWVRSWTTTTLIEPVNGLRPETFDLAMCAAGEPRLGAFRSRPLAQFASGRIVWSPTRPSPSWRVWRALAPDPAQAYPRQLEGLEPVDVVRVLVQAAAADLKAPDLARRFLDWASRTGPLGPELAELVRAQLASLFFELTSGLAAAETADLISCYVVDIWPALGRPYPLQAIIAACDRRVLDRLAPPALETLAREQLFQPPVAARALEALTLARLADDALARVLQAGVPKAGATEALASEPAARLAGALMVEAAARPSSKAPESELGAALVEAWRAFIDCRGDRFGVLALAPLLRLSDRLADLLRQERFSIERLASLKSARVGMDHRRALIAWRLLGSDSPDRAADAAAA